MRYFAYGLGLPLTGLGPALALALALGGATPGTASAGASVESFQEIRPAAAGASAESTQEIRLAAASVDASVEPAPEIRPVDYGLKFNLHIFGLSYHPDREGTRTRHLDNELNIGLGLNYDFHNDARGVASVEAGFYKDSGRNWAKFAGVGYQFKLGDRWRLGADILAAQSPTYNNGRSFVAPIPRLTYDFGAVKLNAIYIPKVRQVNAFDVFAVYLTVPLRPW